MKLLKYSLLLLVLGALCSSCGSDFGLTVDEYILENNLETVALAEGVHIIIHNQGNGEMPPNLDTRVTVKYTGTLTDGDEFDSSENAEFLLRNVIRGWQLGIRAMSKGGSATIIIPSAAGYGDRGSEPSIPGGATLIFEVELLDF